VVWGWVVAQLPDLLPSQITVEEAAAGRPTLIALLVGYGIGAAVLVPALGWLYSLVLRGRLDKPLPALEPQRDERPMP
jgi:cytochrome d ubiquinol oxidase subunit II